MERVTRGRSELTSAIATAIADAKGVDPSELKLILHEHIDTDGIELLASHANSSWTLTFELPEYTVTVTSDGDVSIEEPVETMVP